MLATGGRGVKEVYRLDGKRCSTTRSRASYARRYALCQTYVYSWYYCVIDELLLLVSITQPADSQLS